MYDELKEAIAGAQGVREEWLLDYAERAERCNISHAALVAWIDTMTK